tara:strand:+ start:96 stop:1277 length:1182 start_codon:yes stop_codon:yes gene_type:complete
MKDVGGGELIEFFTDSQKAEIVEMWNDQNYEDLREFCDEILNTSQFHKGAMWVRSACAVVLDEWEKIISISQKARDLSLEFEHDDYHNLALALVRTGKAKEALVECENALKNTGGDMADTEKLHKEILDSLSGDDSSAIVIGKQGTKIRQKFDKVKNVWTVVFTKNDIETIYEINSIIEEQFQPILDLRKQHLEIESDPRPVSEKLTEEEEEEIYQTWFKTVLSIGLKDYTPELLKTLSDDELHSLSTYTYATLEKQLGSNVPTPDDLKNNFKKFSWQQMEDLVGELFEKKGYSTQIGVSSKAGMKRSGDFGIDVRASNDMVSIGIQVKHHSSNVDFDTIAKTLGVSQDYDKVLVINTKTGFTPQAITFANENKKIELWDSEKFNQEITQNFL